MNTGTTIVAGIPIPSTSPAFLLGVAIHVLFGLVCVAAGAGAMLSRKGRGRHATFGAIYFWSITAVAGSASALAASRWAEDWHLFILGVLAFVCAFTGRAVARQKRANWPRWHIAGMGLSYIVLLTAFYVDNGRNLPVWRDLGPLAFWLGPAAIGLPLIGLALLRHPVVRRHGPD